MSKHHLRTAVATALQSRCRHRHGCVVVRNGRVVAKATNKRVGDVHHAWRRSHIHAEIANIRCDCVCCPSSRQRFARQLKAVQKMRSRSAALGSCEDHLDLTAPPREDTRGAFDLKINWLKMTQTASVPRQQFSTRGSRARARVARRGGSEVPNLNGSGYKISTIVDTDLGLWRMSDIPLIYLNGGSHTMQHPLRIVICISNSAYIY
jgi:hypothetical protein